MEVNPHVVDPWFTYDQFEYFFQWAPKQGDPWARFSSLAFLTTAVFFGMLAAMGGINGVDSSFRMCATVFLACFALRFFLFTTHYHEGHYLLWLLGVLTLVTGGGGFFLLFSETDPHTMTPQQQARQRHKRRLLIQSSEWGAVTLRLQYAVVFFFSTLWKLHTDYLQGHVLRMHLLGLLDHHGTPSGGWWAFLEERVGRQLFPFLGMCGILIDLGLFLTMVLRRPAEETIRSHLVGTCLVHLMVAWTMGHQLGYSFSLACLVGGVLLFHPIGGGSNPGTEINAATTHSQQKSALKKRIRRRPSSAEANLLEWIHRYATGSPQARATRPQQLFTLTWLLVQMAIPLRMPWVSQGHYPFNAKGDRFSWTRMMHARQSSVFHVGKYTAATRAGGQVGERVLPLHLFYLLPECSGKTLQRRDYMPERAVAAEDPRTLPLGSILTEQQYAFITAYTRYVVRVGGGMSLVLHQILAPATCNGTHVSVFGIHFAKLNGRGAFCRTLDPTVNMALGEILRYHRSWWATMWSVMLDKAPLNDEILLRGIGTMNPKVEHHRTIVEEKAQGARRIEFVADRAACLSSRPLALWPNSYPLAVMPLQVPANAQLFITSREHREATAFNLTVTAGNQWDILGDPTTTALKLNHPHPVTAVSVEIGILINDLPKASRVPRCGDTTDEDVLFALIFMS